MKVVRNHRTLDKSKQKGNDGLSSLWIVGEFLFVVAMLSQCPQSHLVETSHSEDGSWKRGKGNVLASRLNFDQTYQANFEWEWRRMPRHTIRKRSWDSSRSWTTKWKDSKWASEFCVPYCLEGANFEEQREWKNYRIRSTWKMIKHESNFVKANFKLNLPRRISSQKQLGPCRKRVQYRVDDWRSSQWTERNPSNKCSSWKDSLWAWSNGRNGEQKWSPTIVWRSAKSNTQQQY